MPVDFKEVNDTGTATFIIENRTGKDVVSFTRHVSSKALNSKRNLRESARSPGDFQMGYKFRRLEQENGRLLGITKKGSATAVKVVGLPSTYDEELLKVDLSQVTIEEIRLRNNTLSTVVNVLIPVFAVVAAVVASDPEFFLPD